MADCEALRKAYAACLGVCGARCWSCVALNPRVHGCGLSGRRSGSLTRR